MILYGIRNKKTKKPLGVDAQASDFEEGSVVEFSFDEDGTIPIWLVTSRKYAEKAKDEDPQYYNAGYESPRHGYIDFVTMMEDYEVFEIEIGG